MKKNNQIQNYNKNFQKIFVKDYLEESYFLKTLNKTKLEVDISILNERLKKYVLLKLYRKKIITNKDIKLEDVHKFITRKSLIIDKKEFDITRNILTECFFVKDNEFFKIYHDMIKYIKKKLKFNFLFQKDPFLRFNFPVQRKKIDNFLPHVDAALGHPPGEINVWLPVTNVNKFNSMGISDYEKSMNFFSKYNYNFDAYIKKYNNRVKNSAMKIIKPYVSKGGKAILFDGRVMHKTILNKSSFTRVSLDFRILPKIFEKSAKKYVGTGYLKQKFVKGHYYESKII